MNAGLVDSGVAGMGPVAWGSHLCHFFDDAEGALDVLVPFFAAGLRGGEQCTWMTSAPLTVADARRALGAVVPDLAEHERTGRVAILDYRDWWLRRGSPEPRALVQLWKARFERALAAGYHGVRQSGSATWVGAAGRAAVLEIEAEANRLVRERRIVALCGYCAKQSSGAEVLEVLARHDAALHQGTNGWGVLGRSGGDRLERARAIGAVAHDLRGPLSALRLGSEHLGELRDSTVRAIGRRLARTTSRMQRMVDELLDYSRATSGMALPLHRQPTEVDRLCAEVVAEVRLAHPRVAVALSVDAPEACLGRWDPDRLYRAIENLLVNAIHHRDGDTEICLRVLGEPGAVCIEVENDGQPIPAEGLARIFEPFARSGSSRGLGLGLYIARAVALAHAGDLSLTCAAGRVTATLRLPRQPS